MKSEVPNPSKGRTWPGGDHRPIKRGIRNELRALGVAACQWATARPFELSKLHPPWADRRCICSRLGLELMRKAWYQQFTAAWPRCRWCAAASKVPAVCHGGPGLGAGSHCVHNGVVLTAGVRRLGADGVRQWCAAAQLVPVACEGLVPTVSGSLVPINSARIDAAHHDSTRTQWSPSAQWSTRTNSTRGCVGLAQVTVRTGWGPVLPFFR